MKSTLIHACTVGIVSAFAFAFASAPSEARAAVLFRTNCTITSIQADAGGTQSRLFISGTCTEGALEAYGYLGFGCSVAAVNASKETFEGWRSLAQAALLSGRKVNVTYENASTCGNAMYALQLL